MKCTTEVKNARAKAAKPLLVFHLSNMQICDVLVVVIFNGTSPVEFFILVKALFYFFCFE